MKLVAGEEDISCVGFYLRCKQESHRRGKHASYWNRLY
jgi:hypothetical protein